MSSIADAASLGAGLRAARLSSARSLAELAQATKVHSRYLIALEENDYSVLPSRVFAIGYVRAYASALGLDEQLAAERFKREAPDGSAPDKLEAPVGVAFEEVRRYSPRLIGAAVMAVLAVVGWNVFQRVSLIHAPQPSDIAEAPENWTVGAIPGQDGSVRLTAPQPAPADQTVPALYVTPGLEAQLTGIDPTADGAVPASTAPVQAAFNPRGAIYGASSTASHVVLQARKAAALVVRMSDGRVLFARQLAAGEAWRAPVGVAAVIDASTDFGAFDIYLNGEHGGALQAELTPLAQLNARAEQMARQVAVRAEAARRAAVQAASDVQASAGAAVSGMVG